MPLSATIFHFFDQILLLFFGCFLLSVAIKHSGLDRRIALKLISTKLATHSVTTLTLALPGCAFFLSMWMSNTAAAAICIPVALGFLTTLKQQVVTEREQKLLQYRLLLGTAFAASLGGLVTPIGSPPNMIALGLLSEQNIEISLLKWISVAGPAALLAFFIMALLLAWLYPLPKINLEAVRTWAREENKNLGVISRYEKRIAGVFSVMIILWMAPDILKNYFYFLPLAQQIANNLSLGVVGAIGAILLMVLPRGDGPRLLSWRDAREVDWPTLALFGGGLTLGAMLSSSGLANSIGQTLVTLGQGSSLVLVVALGVTAILLSEFASNTAAASILLPIAIGIGSTTGQPENQIWALSMACTMGTSFGFMLPISTPPNAIVYATGLIPGKEMLKTGMGLDIAGLLVLLGFYYYLIY
jgi:sodium-dependent dicarboxylate transporter 2/3/5